jgi:salicylate hydroxylase
MMVEQIAIVGAGIGGLSTALGLLRSGREVRVYEQAPELGDVGAGLSISPNAALGLDWLGMLDFMEQESNIPLWQYTHHGVTDEVLVAIDRGPVREQYGAAYYQIHRADFHAELVRRVVELGGDDCIQLGRKLGSIAPDGDGYQLVFAGHGPVEARAVIGADGLRSVVRDQLFASDRPEFTGHQAWRALIPAHSLPGWYSDRASHVWVGPGKTSVCYPVRGHEFVNFVGFARAEAWVEEGWTVPAGADEISSAFDGWHAHVTDLVAAIPENSAFRWGLFARQPLDALSKGRVALLGDAAHPMLPWFGQGASSSIEDSVVLVRCVVESRDLSDAFARYSAARLERVRFLQRESNLGGERLQALDPYVLRGQPARNEDAMGIFRYDPAQVPI